LKGEKKGKKKRYMIWNVADHAETNKEVGAQAVSYTTGVPAVVGAIMIFKGHWKGEGVFNVEQLPPVPYLEELGKQGLPWHVKEIDKQDQKKLFAVET
jgi:saccharopine dehydrogenase (NAD+, L-lysine-forming)